MKIFLTIATKETENSRAFKFCSPIFNDEYSAWYGYAHWVPPIYKWFVNKRMCRLHDEIDNFAGSYFWNLRSPIKFGVVTKEVTITGWIGNKQVISGVSKGWHWADCRCGGQCEHEETKLSINGDGSHPDLPIVKVNEPHSEKTNGWGKSYNWSYAHLIEEWVKSNIPSEIELEVKSTDNRYN